MGQGRYLDNASIMQQHGMIEDEDEPTYNFMPSEPASRIAQGQGGEGVYSQRGCWWYFDGRNGAVQIPMLGHLNQQELLTLGRDTLKKRLIVWGGWEPSLSMANAPST